MNKTARVSAFADVFAAFMAERSGFGGGDREELATVCSSLITLMQDGHTCLNLDKNQEKRLLRCPLVSEQEDSPLVIAGGRLYLSRYFMYERQLAQKIAGLASVSYSIDNLDDLLGRCFPAVEEEQDLQREAARVALSKGLCIISGGPGTGKTTTVVKIAALLLAYYGPSCRIALSAPTGKAAMRLKESVAAQIPLLPLEDTIKEILPREAQTLHRLLGARRHSPSFIHNRKRLLPWDAVIVDEASMVDVALMSKLVEALSAGTRLVLLGDKDQLASVESGAVLSECMRILRKNVVELQVAHRFNAEISALAGTIKNGNKDALARILEDSNSPSVEKAAGDWLAACADRYERYFRQVRVVDGKEGLPALFRLFNSFRILCALRNGPSGVVGLNEKIERILSARGFACEKDTWYPGRPVIVTRNDYNLGLYNGDIGICLPESIGSQAFSVWFETEAGVFRRFMPVRLPPHETAWALTIHKSQGSEFSEIAVVLPEHDQQVLGRELLYTAVTRAREKVIIRDPASLCGHIVSRLTERGSGLAEQLQCYYEDGDSG
ncbi:MAG: exodeoxyribonuclease V subunit alpha [Desulfocapsaceae bacterium]|jgi:exodeoxyribonuclease V alpha subunit|nr:exodeoxyribonuclease V subunit alpha [Desulfocapsaceae bacterium]